MISLRRSKTARPGALPPTVWLAWSGCRRRAEITRSRRFLVWPKGGNNDDDRTTLQRRLRSDPAAHSPGSITHDCGRGGRPRRSAPKFASSAERNAVSSGIFAVHAFDEGRPVLVVMPDGVEFLYEPRTDLVSRLSRWWTARFASRDLRSMSPLVIDDSEWTDLDIGNAGFRHRVHGRRPVTAV